MTEPEKLEAVRQLKRLRQKAELCRYAHGRMRGEACVRRRLAEIVGALLSLAVCGLGFALYRDPDLAMREMFLLSIVVLPLLGLFVQRVSRIFGWSDMETRCEIAVNLWGQWVREADFLGGKISRLSEEEAEESMRGVEEKYKACMDKTPPIPERNFLRYKADFFKYKMLSETIDNASERELDEIRRKLGGTKTN